MSYFSKWRAIGKWKWLYAFFILLFCIALGVLVVGLNVFFEQRNKVVPVYRDCPFVELVDANGNVLAKITDRADILRLWDSFDWWFTVFNNYRFKGSIGEASIGCTLAVFYPMNDHDPYNYTSIDIMPNDDVTFIASLNRAYRKPMPNYCAVVRSLVLKYKNEPMSQP